MKTRGIDIVEGWIVVAYGRGIPDPFWARLKHHVLAAGLVDAYREDYTAKRADVLASMPRFPSERDVHTACAEERLFRCWAERVAGPQALWPWERGWTEDLVDGFLSSPAKAREAA